MHNRTKTKITYPSPAWRRHLFPIFTRNQAIFLSLIILISFGSFGFGSSFGLAVSGILLSAALGSLSITVPAVLETPSEGLPIIRQMLRAGRWFETPDNVWRRSDHWLRSWENDQIRMLLKDNMLYVTGPLFTLRKLKSALK